MLSRAVFVLSLAALAILGYGPTLGIGFLSDDFVLVERVATTGLPLRTGTFFRPLVWLAFWVDWSLWGLHAVGYHVTNLALHTLNAGLVSVLAGRLGLAPWPSVFAAGLFLLLPSHTESVTWIAGRSDLLATLGLLGALIGYLRWRAAGSRSSLGMAGLAFTAALLAKESAVVLPVVLLILEIGWLARPIRWPGIVGSAGLVAAYLPLRAWAIGGWIGGYGVGEHLALHPDLILRHVVLSLARVVLSPWPEWLAAPLLPHLYVTPRRGLVLLVVVAVIGWVCSRRVLTLTLAALACLPLLGRQGVELTDTRGERFLYTASVFAVLLVAIGMARIPARSAVAATVLVASLAALWSVNAEWRSAGRLVDQALADPHRAAVVAHHRGRWVFHNGWPEAQWLFSPDKVTMKGRPR